MGEFANPALNALTESLDATGVLSDDYKSRVIGYALAACSEAYKAGQEKASGSAAVGATVQPVRSVTTNPGDFRKFIAEAIENDEPVKIDYTDQFGRDSVDRLIWPTEVEDGRFGSTLIRAIDDAEDEPRAFRLDRITKVAVEPDA